MNIKGLEKKKICLRRVTSSKSSFFLFFSPFFSSYLSIIIYLGIIVVVHFGIVALLFVGLEYHNGFFDLGLQRFLVFQHMDQFRVVNFQKHSGNFSGQFRMPSLNQREKTLANICFCSDGGAWANIEA